MALEITTLEPAGRFGEVCETGILDLRPICKDEVILNIPVLFGRWEDGTNMPVLNDDNWSITYASEACDISVANHETLECYVKIPDQEQVAVGWSGQERRDLWQRFCKAKGITRAPSILRRDGSLDEGSPLLEPFINYLMSEHRLVVMKSLRQNFWSSDSNGGANLHRWDGFLTQLADGPGIPAGQDAGCGETYGHIELDWATMTGNAGGVSHPDATIDAAHDTITIKGWTFSGLTGLSLIEFVRLWYERMVDHELASFSAGEWEWWLPPGSKTCIAEAAGCMTSCAGCVRPTEEVQGNRSDEFRRTGVINIRPYEDVPFTLRQSSSLSNRHIILPKMVDNRPTVAMVFRDQITEDAILNGALPMFGTTTGLPGETPLYPDRDMLSQLAEARMFTLDVQKNGTCVDSFIKYDGTVMIGNWNVILDIQNVSCTGLIPETCEESMSVAVSSCVANPGAELDRLQMNATGLGAVAGDTYRVTFTDTSVLIGTVISYSTPTLVLEFGVNLDCDFGGGPATVTKIYDA